MTTIQQQSMPSFQQRHLPVAPLAVAAAKPPTHATQHPLFQQPPSPALSTASAMCSSSPLPPLSPLSQEQLQAQQAAPLTPASPCDFALHSIASTQPTDSPALPSQAAAPVSHAQKHLHGRTLCAAFSSRYALRQELGAGGFGFVCSAVRLADGANVAVKFILKSNMAHAAWVSDRSLGRVPLEVYVLKNINHPNIIAFLDYYEDDAFCYLVTELHGCSWSQPQSHDASTTHTQPANIPSRPSMDLFECIERHERFTEAQARHVFRQIVSAISHLHAVNLVHRDIKDENILIDEHFNIKLIDFGSTSFYDPSGLRRFDRFLGTIQYAAPEILKAQKYRGPEAEIWALGCCLYIMLTGQVPFASAAQAAHRRYTWPQCALSAPCAALLDAMFDKNPETRATIGDVAAHAWLSGH